MLFNSYIFILLLVITFGLYYIPKLGRFQVLILIIASLVFYSYDQLEFVLLLLFSAGVNILTSYYVVYGNVKRKKTLALTGVIVNLCALAFFKYSPLISKTFLDPSDSIGNFLLHIPLPIGISFFTFEGISLLMDVWKEKYVDNKQIVPKSLAKHAQHTLFFISFFPHLIAGPILKAHEFFPQIKEKYFRDIQWEAAFKNLVTGYFLKMVIADNLKDFTHLMAEPYYFSSITLFILVLGYSFQIFADFAGYSLIAIGLAKLFVYNFNINFNFPYISTSFKEFWKRWHISLSTFLMEYLYFSLGGNRKGKVRTYFNLLLTMTLGGLWHGAAWTYALWGFTHGAALAIERYINDNTTLKLNRLGTIIKGIFVFLFVSAAWILFRLTPDGVKLFVYYAWENLTKSLSVLDIHLITFTLMYSLPVILYHAIYLYKDKKYWPQIKRTEYIFYAVMLFLIITNSGTSGSFIYFQF
ncbi:MAG: MBOAT family O-acyltransferase [Dysgonomonas sp.]